MKRYFAGAFTALALATSFAGTPAHAEHTLCDNESENPGNQEIWLPSPGSEVGAGLDYNDLDEGTLYVCAFHGLTTNDSYILIVIRTGGQQTICPVYTSDGNPANDICVLVPPS